MSHTMRGHAASLEESGSGPGRSRRLQANGRLSAAAAHENMVRSAVTYRLVTRAVLASAFSFLASIIIIAPALNSAFLGGLSAVVVVLPAGVAILTVLASTFVVRRRDHFSSDSALSTLSERTLTPAEIAKYTRDLSSEDEARRLGAFYFLATVAETSNAEARLIVPAVESFIQSALRSKKNTDDLISSWRRADVQSALEFLGRLPTRTRWGPGGPIRYRLSNLDFRGYDFGALDFSAADLRGSDLSGCTLGLTNFDGADLRYAILQDVTAVRASFRGALLERTDCKGGFFVEADFSEALLSFAKLDGAVLSRAKLSNSVLLYSGIADADFGDVELACSGGQVSKLTAKYIDEVMSKQRRSSEAAVIEFKERRDRSDL